MELTTEQKKAILREYIISTLTGHSEFDSEVLDFDDGATCLKTRMFLYFNPGIEIPEDESIYPPARDWLESKGVSFGEYRLLDAYREQVRDEFYVPPPTAYGTGQSKVSIPEFIEFIKKGIPDNVLYP